MRIVVVSQNPSMENGGGSDAVFLEHVKLLRDSGHEVLPFCALQAKSNDMQNLYGEFFPMGADFQQFDVKNLSSYVFNVEARRRMAEAIALFKPDICHLHIYYGKVTPSILKPLRDAGIPCVQTLHEYRYSCAVSVPYRGGFTCFKCSAGSYLPALTHKCNRGSILRSAFSVLEMYTSDLLGGKRMDHFVCVSNKQRDYLLERGLPSNSSSVIYNTIDGIFRRSVAPRNRSVLYVGRIERYKGIDVVIEMARRITDAQFIVIGNGNYKEEFLQKAASCPNVVYEGELSREGVFSAMSQASCLIVPSQWEETFGLISAEAMACGTPVVASHIGGIPEVVTDGVDGFLVGPTGHDQFEHRIRILLDDANTWTRFSEAGIAKIAQNFSAETHLRSLLHLYDELVNR